MSSMVNAMRTSNRLSGFVVAAALVAAACGDDAGTDATTTDATVTTEAAAAATDDGGFPREVAHALGTTTIEAEPSRIVSVGLTEHDFLLAVGVVPVGVTDWYGDQPFATWPWAQDELGDAEPAVLTATDGIDFESVAALDPDLIIGTNAGLDEESYELLSDIAPTIAHPEGTEGYFSRWDEQAALIAEAIGEEDEMAAIVDDIEQRFAAAAADHPEFAGARAIFLQNAFYDGSAIAYQDGLSTEFLTDLGFEVPASLDEFATEGGQAYVPLENLSVLDDADVLIWGTEAPEDRAALESEPVYTSLEEVRDGRLVFTDGTTAGAIYFTSPLSLPFVLEHLVPALASTIAGDGPAVIGALG